MKKLLIAALATVAVASATTLHTGGQGKNYNGVIGPSLQKQASKQGINLTVVTSKGSVDNLNKVVGTSDLGLAQANVVNPLIDSDPKYENIGSLGSVGVECAFPVVPVVDGRPAKLSSLAGENIAAGRVGSGDRFSFNQLAEMNPELAALNAKPRGGLLYLGKVANGYYGASFFFSIPDPKNELIKEVLNNPKITFADAEEIKLGKLGEGRNPSLFYQDLKLGNTAMTAVCTNVNVIADESKIDQHTAGQIYKATKDVRAKQVTAKDMFNDAKSWGLNIWNKVKQQ